MYFKLISICALSLTAATGCTAQSVASPQAQAESLAIEKPDAVQQARILVGNPYVDKSGNIRYYYISTPIEPLSAVRPADRVKTASISTRGDSPRFEAAIQPRGSNIIATNYSYQTPSSFNERRILKTGPHLISEGETVYSLAKNRCSTVQTIQLINTLDSTYKIKAGQRITLPVSQC